MVRPHKQPQGTSDSNLGNPSTGDTKDIVRQHSKWHSILFVCLCSRCDNINKMDVNCVALFLGLQKTLKVNPPPPPPSPPHAVLVQVVARLFGVHPLLHPPDVVRICHFCRGSQLPSLSFDATPHQGPKWGESHKDVSGLECGVQECAERI